VPREHGAWMMLYTPFVMAAVVSYPFPPRTILLTAAAMTAAFFAQNVAGQLLRGRARDRAVRWLALYLGGLAACGGALVLRLGRVDLIWLAVPALALFAWQGWQKKSTGRQVDRGIAAELSTVAVLSLSAPAAAIAARGEATSIAWLLWAACSLYFGSSVFYVKMLVARARTRAPEDPAPTWTPGRQLVFYHMLVVVALAGVSTAVPALVASLWVVAYAPAVTRALVAWSRPQEGMPSLKQVGVKEIVYALWFAVFFCAGALTGLS
jgi:hypothetical protein